MKKKHCISFRIAAYTDAAGKYSAEAVRSGNEDNFFVDDDLTDTTPGRVSQDEVLQLGELGMLMAVADGMGGMNAGEVASQIAVDTVKAAFNKESLSASVTATPQSRQKYMESIIKQADKNIKSEARKDSSREGMGSTIILAWLFNDELTISWCGDSRAYIFNDKSGLRLISQDHSYVQELVNKGLLTYEQTFDHPQNNILVRSLGDPTKDANPESKTLKVGKGDIILLCSDGLSGVLRDRKTYDGNGQLLPEDNIEDIIRSHKSSMKECREALWEAAERADWYDNVTAILCQITDGPESLWSIIPADVSTNKSENRSKRTLLISGIAFLVMVAIATAFYLGRRSGSGASEKETPTDSIIPVSPVGDSDPFQDNVSEIHEEVSNEESVRDVSEKPTVREQIKIQSEQNADTVSSNPNGLTKIERVEKTDSKENGKLTPIKDKMKKDPAENPLTPTNSKKDNITENPLNNQ